MVKKHVADLKTRVEQLEKDILSLETDTTKFYKKGIKRAGIRLRKYLWQLIEEMMLMRKDILKLYRESDGN